MIRSLSTLFAASLFVAFPVRADMGHAAHGMSMDHAAMTTALSEGLVKKVDKAQGKLTLRHGPLENLGMPGMTMVFRVQDPGWLERVKPGDSIRFLADKVNGVLTVTQLETLQ